MAELYQVKSFIFSIKFISKTAIMSGINFYKDLKTSKLPVTEVFYQDNFFDVPADWFIIIADIKNSTAAVSSGKHNDVNLVAAGSLIAALNIAKGREIEIPFFFGGDGGTLLVPEQLLNDVLTGLFLHNLNSIKNFGLELHLGSISIKDILDAGHFIKIAKIQFGGFDKAVVIGDGLRFAEQLIKHSTKDRSKEPDNTNELNLTGLECRWDKIKPPSEENEIVCYLIETVNPAKQLEVYHNVLLKIDEIYGDIEKRNPLSLDRLKLLLGFKKIKKEMMAKYGKWKIYFFITTFLKTFFGRFYFRYNLKIGNLWGRDYLTELISNADTLIIDGRINTIISGKMDRRIQFLEYLAMQEKEGNLIYGHHINKESIMTCYIENRKSKHIHFVDGSDGGCTEAAKEFKMKLKQS